MVIKFKIWNREAKTMYSWEELIGAKGVGVFTWLHSQRKEYYNYLLQYIGREDRNGAEIYKDDIIAVTNPENQVQKKKILGIVVFSNASFGVEIKSVPVWEGYDVDPPSVGQIIWFLNIDSSNIVRIGSKWENQDLESEYNWLIQQNVAVLTDSQYCGVNAQATGAVMKYKCTEDRFLSDVSSHEIQVIRDEGMNRHIRFRKPGTICYGFDLITWPGHLCVSGDLGTYVFRRIEDMFGFFRDNDYLNRQHPGRKLFINRGYWEEKVLAEDKIGKIKEFSLDNFNSAVTEWFSGWCRDYPDRKHDFREIWTSLKDNVMNPENSNDGYSKAMDFECKGFEMNDFCECNCDEYTFGYEWCLYAIVWGISEYDKMHERLLKEED